MSARGPYLAEARGFTLIELLVATLVVIAIAGALAAMAAPLRTAFDRTLATGEITVRSRTGVERLIAELREAGSASGGLSRIAIADVWPVIVPIAAIDDPRVVAPSQAVRLVMIRDDAGQGVVRRAVVAGDTLLDLDAPGRCAQSRGVCGFIDNVQALVFDASRADVVTVRAVDPSRMALVLDRPLIRAFDIGAAVIGIEEVSYGLREDADGAMRLVRVSGGGAEQPIVDHVVQFEIAASGASSPPEPRPGPETLPTYGPRPPSSDADDERDTWGLGENCIIAVDDDGRPSPRLPSIGLPPAPVPLSAAVLTDGPWCPDGNVATFDADLLRLRRIDVVLRVEAASANFRGPAAGLFRRPGTARRSAEWVPDVESRISITLRSR